jgi:hypothetical protein
MQPGQAVDVLNDRVRQVGRLNTEIADWLQVCMRTAIGMARRGTPTYTICNVGTEKIGGTVLEWLA